MQAVKLSLAVAGLSMAHTALGENMNGAYTIASGGGKQNVPYNTDYAAKGHSYFDVYAPEIATHYGESFWTSQGNQPLPAHIVAKFDGKVIAITGYEQDQVMVFPTGKPGVNSSQDVSVPITWAYNHHYMMWMTGKDAEMTYVEAGPDDVSAHGAPLKWVAVDKPSAALRDDTSIPVKQLFSEGNGGESRKSFHGYPDGYAQLVDSPTEWHITPMQLDTRNRDCGITAADLGNCTGYSGGPEPKQARYGLGIPKGGTNVSGILECPCNSRYGGDPSFYPDSQTKIIVHDYAGVSEGVCAGSQDVLTADACFQAVAKLGMNATSFKNKTVTDSTMPKGCSVVTGIDDGGLAVVYFNKAASTEQCHEGKLRTAAVAFEIGTSLDLSVDLDADLVTMTVSGPGSVWFGVGFNAQLMIDAPYTLIINSTAVIEQKIGTCGSEAEHCPGDELSSSVKVLSNTVADGRRTVVLTRPVSGATKDHYTFTDTTVGFISAIGQSQTFERHVAHSVSVATLSTAGAPTCVCDTGAAGKLCETGGEKCEQFIKDCVAEPIGDLLSQDNPTCNSRQYAGGLRCCAHQRIMQDADQEIRPELLKYHMKIRFWYQEYTLVFPDLSASHSNLERYYYTTEANAGEYDVPPAFVTPGIPIPGYPNWPEDTPTPGTTCTGTCPNGPDCACVHEITYHWTMSDARLIYAGGHCHAPSCTSIHLYRNDTGTPQLVCAQLPLYGAGNVTHDKYDEADYASIPPCLWGDDEGLEPSVLLPANTPMFSIKKNDNTHLGHYGEMASWQMRGTPY